MNQKKLCFKLPLSYLEIILSLCIVAYALRFFWWWTICVNGCTGFLANYDILDVVFIGFVGAYFLRKAVSNYIVSIRKTDGQSKF